MNSNKMNSFENFNEIEMFDVLSSILKFEFEDMVKLTPQYYAINQDLSSARKELLIYIMQCKDKVELNELIVNNQLSGLIDRIDEDYYEAMSNSCVIFSRLVVKIIEASEKCVENLKYLKASLKKTNSLVSITDLVTTKDKRDSNLLKRSTIETPRSETTESNLENQSLNPDEDNSNFSSICIDTAKVVIKNEEKTPPLKLNNIARINQEYEYSIKNFKLVGKHRIYSCQKCSYQANDKNNFREHLLKHYNYKRKSLKFKCRYCDYHGCNSFFLKKHERDYHKSIYQPRKIFMPRNIHSCSMCPFRARSKGHLQAHVVNHQYNKNYFKCRYCDFYLEFNNKMSIHELIHPEYEPISTEDKFNSCNLCPYKTLKLLSFKKHLENHAHKKGGFKCRYCNYYLWSSPRLKDHERLHPEYEEKEIRF